MRRSLLPLLPLLVASCVTDGPAVVDGGPKTGDEGGPCFMNGTCNAGLVCVIPNTCVKPDAMTADGGNGVGDAGQSDADGDGAPECYKSALGYWRFDGTGNDFLGSLNLTQVNGVNFPSGKFAQAMNGSPGYMKSGATTTLGGLTELTVELWIAHDTMNAMPRRLVYYGDTMTMAWMLQIAASLDYVDFFINNVGTITTMSFGADGKFHHIAFTFRASLLKAYVDGNLRDMKSGMAMVLPTSPNGLLAVGADAMGQYLYDGKIDDLAIYGVALSDSQIKAIAQSTSPSCRSK